MADFHEIWVLEQKIRKDAHIKAGGEKSYPPKAPCGGVAVDNKKIIFSDFHNGLCLTHCLAWV